MRGGRLGSSQEDRVPDLSWPQGRGAVGSRASEEPLDARTEGKRLGVLGGCEGLESRTEESVLGKGGVKTT